MQQHEPHQRNGFPPSLHAASASVSRESLSAADVFFRPLNARDRAIRAAPFSSREERLVSFNVPFERVHVLHFGRATQVGVNARVRLELTERDTVYPAQ